MSAEAEVALISSLLAGGYSDIPLTQADFFVPRHGKVFAAMQSSGPDRVLLAAELEKRGQLEEVGGKHSLVDYDTGLAHTATRYAAIVKEASDWRIIERAKTEMHGDSPADALSHFHEATSNVGSAAAADKVSDLLAARHKTLEKPRDYVWLEQFPGVHLHFGDMCVIGARPSVGKSAFGIQHAEEWSERGLPVLVYDYEMGDEDWCDRLIMRHTPFTTDHLDRGLTEDEANLARSATETLGRNLWHVDAVKANLTLPHLLAHMRRFARGLKGRKGIVIVDYLQLTTKQTYEDVTEASRLLKLTAKSTDLLVVCLSQLKRRPNTDDRKEREPELDDLRQSGAIEQDADDVILLHQYTPERAAELKTKLAERGYLTSNPIHLIDELALVDFAKLRRGKKGGVMCWWVAEDQTFTSIDRSVP